MPTKDTNQLIQIHRAMSHYEAVEMQFYRVPEYTTETNLNMRIEFMMGKLDETVFKTRLQAQEKRRAKKKAIHDIMTMVCTVMGDIFRNMIGDELLVKKLGRYSLEMDALREYSNEQLTAVSDIYGCVVPILSDTFYVDSINPSMNKKRRRE